MEELSNKIKKFLEIEETAIKKAKKREKIRINVNPDSYIGREIRYQTALLKDIEAQNMEIIKILNEKKENPYNLPEEKSDWLEEIGAFPFDEPVIYGIMKNDGVSYVMTKKYINETPIEELKRDFERIKDLVI